MRVFIHPNLYASSILYIFCLSIDLYLFSPFVFLVTVAVRAGRLPEAGDPSPGAASQRLRGGAHLGGQDGRRRVRHRTQHETHDQVTRMRGFSAFLLINV